MAHKSCTHPSASSSTHQTLDEFDFERGIWTAVLHNDDQALENHLNKGHLHDRDSAGYTALHYAARTGNLAIFKRLVYAGADVNAQTHGGVTSFHRACMQGHDNIVAFLLKHCKQLNPKLVDSDGQNALHRAAQSGLLSTATLILSVTELNHLKCASDNRGRTPLDLVPVGEQFRNLRHILR